MTRGFDRIFRMATPCFIKHFYDGSDEEFEKALRTMKAAVVAARSGNKDHIK